MYYLAKSKKESKGNMMGKIEIESFISNILKDICEDEISVVDMQAELNEVGIILWNL